MTAEPTGDDRRWAALAKRREETALAEVRGIAEKWRAGLVALAGLVTTALAVASPYVATQIEPSVARSIVGVLAIVAAGILVFGAWLAMSAAFGDLGYIPNSGEALRSASRSAAEKAIDNLRHAKVLTVLGLVLLLAAAGVSFFAIPRAEPAPQLFRVTAGSHSYCGSVGGNSKPGEVHVTGRDGTVHRVQLNDETNIEAVNRC